MLYSLDRHFECRSVNFFFHKDMNNQYTSFWIVKQVKCSKDGNFWQLRYGHWDVDPEPDRICDRSIRQRSDQAGVLAMHTSVYWLKTFDFALSQVANTDSECGIDFHHMI
jgi:hypothetical protein